MEKIRDIIQYMLAPLQKPKTVGVSVMCDFYLTCLKQLTLYKLEITNYMHYDCRVGFRIADLIL